ncbi:unnamed protein product, partial [Prorocentrum cordatum]
AEHKQLAGHRDYLASIEKVIQEAQARSVLPVPKEADQPPDPVEVMASMESFTKLFERASEQFGVDFNAQVRQMSEKHDKLKSEVASASAAPRGAAAAGAPEGAGGGAAADAAMSDAPVELDIEDPDVAQHCADAGVSGIDKAFLKRLMDGPRGQGGESRVAGSGDGAGVGNASGPSAAAGGGGDAGSMSANDSSWASGQGLLEWARLGQADGPAALPQVVCLQEHRLKSSSTASAASERCTRRGYSQALALAESTEEGALNSSGGVSVLSRLPAATHGDTCHFQLPSHRVVSLVVNVGLKIPLHVVSLYLVTSVWMSTDKIGILAGRLMSYIGSSSGPWIALGDWNLLPEQVRELASAAEGGD